MKKLFLFDVDGTLTESSKKISIAHAKILNKLKEENDIGVLGGGELNKILSQFDNLVYFNHYFTECGNVYNFSIDDENFKLKEIYKNDIRQHYLYEKINILVKLALKFISEVKYVITGNFIDLRVGLIYISLIGMSANDIERKYFMEIDKTDKIRENLIKILYDECKKMGIHDKLSINIGGSVGIAIYPVENDKVQVLDYLKKSNDYDEIYYFGDKFEKGGNDYEIIKKLGNRGFKINNIEDSYNIIKENLIK